MATDLGKLVEEGSVKEMQEKLETWHRDYQKNSCGENMDRCCEIIELNTAIQKRLFLILDETSKADPESEAAEKLRKRFLPNKTVETCPPNEPVETCHSCCHSDCESESSVTSLKDLADAQTCRLQELEDNLAATRMRIHHMEEDLCASRAEECQTLRNIEEVKEYEDKIQALRDDLCLLEARKAVIANRLAAGNCAPKCQPCCPAPAKRCCTAPAKRCCTMPSKPCCPPAKGKNGSPAQTKRVNSSRRACLIARYSFIFAHERMDAEATLRTFICDMELVQRIIYIAALECFRVAKMAFWKIKTTVKHNLSLTHSEPPPLDVAVLDYIIYHKDVYDVFESVHEVICAMDMNPKISYPPVVDFVVITTLIKELCAVAFAMQTLDPPLDVTCGIDGELFNRTMYYRSSDSDHTAGYVAYHVWPPLMENGVVIVKGEVVTRSMSFRKKKSRSRSCSCSRRLAPGQVTRSRSLSTVGARKSKNGN